MPPTPETRANTGRVSDALLRAAKSADKPYKIAVGGALYLEVSPNGSKLWRWKYRVAGKENRYAIGSYPAVLLKQAKDQRDDARKLVKAGIHPSHQKKLDDIRKATDHANTFEAVAREWIAANAKDWTHRTRMQRERILARDVFPHIGALPVRQVTPAHVLSIVKRIEKRAPEMAVIAKQAIGAICRLAVVTLRADADPTNPLRGSLKARKTKHHRPLTTAELPKFIRAIDDSGSSFTNQIALRLTLLTLVRGAEILNAKWSELDLEKALWTVPASRMKMRDDHLVPLTSQSLELLKRLQVVTGHREHLFPNRDHPTKPVSHGVLRKAVLRMGFDDFSPHGIRSTGSTMLNDMGFRADLIEKQLAHEQRNESRRAYDRSTLIDERRPMMQHWADYLDGLVTGAQVVSIRRGAA